MTLALALLLFGLAFCGAFISGLVGVGGAVVMIPLLYYVPPLLGAGQLPILRQCRDRHRVARQVRVLPRGPLRLLVPDANAEPRRRPELAMSRRGCLRHEHSLADVVQREERDRVEKLIEEHGKLSARAGHC